MYVDINGFRRHPEMEHRHRVSIFRQQGMIGIVHGLAYERIVYNPPVYNKGLVLPAAFQERRLGNKTVHLHFFSAYREHFSRRVNPIECRQYVQESPVARCLNNSPSVVDQPESNAGIGHGQFPQHGVNPSAFSSFGFEKFFPCQAHCKKGL